MTEQAPTPHTAGFKDRSIGLTLFGIVEILIGGFCALMAPFTALSAIVGQAGGAAVSARMMIPAIAFYALLGVAFVWIGIGSILARRWARALMVVLSWLWLICGLLGLVVLAVFMPGMFEQIVRQAPQGQQLPPLAVTMILVITGAILSCIYVFLPAAFILFYQSKHVRATCELRDPQIRWTDKCPLPVLALSILLGFTAYSMIWALFYGGVFPVFGILISGAPGALVLLVLTFLLCYLAWGTYKLKIAVWWGTLALIALWTLSAIITLSRVGLMEMYKKMGFPEEQLELIRQTGILEKMPINWSIGIGTAVYLGYMLYVRRYFITSAK